MTRPSEVDVPSVTDEEERAALLPTIPRAPRSFATAPTTWPSFEDTDWARVVVRDGRLLWDQTCADNKQ